MSNASITLKLTPTQFDLIREELAERQVQHHKAATDNDVAPAIRHVHRQRASELTFLLNDWK